MLKTGGGGEGRGRAWSMHCMTLACILHGYYTNAGAATRHAWMTTCTARGMVVAVQLTGKVLLLWIVHFPSLPATRKELLVLHRGSAAPVHLCQPMQRAFTRAALDEACSEALPLVVSGQVRDRLGPPRGSYNLGYKSTAHQPLLHARRPPVKCISNITRYNRPAGRCPSSCNMAMA